MAPNDIILLDKLLGQKKKDLAETLADDTYFEIFTFEQVLKNYELSYEELLEGRVGGADDGGIDGFFVFAGSIAKCNTWDSRKGNAILSGYAEKRICSPVFV